MSTKTGFGAEEGGGAAFRRDHRWRTRRRAHLRGSPSSRAERPEQMRCGHAAALRQRKIALPACPPQR